MSDGRWPLPETWSWARSADIAKIAGGGTPRADDERNFTENGIKWITPADLTGYSDVYIGGGRRDLSERGLATSGATLLPKGTVLFSSRAPVGYCAIAANEMSTNQGFKSLVLDDEILPEYVRHYLLSAKEYAESLASGTTFLELSGKRMAELQIPLPPLSEQQRIVKKLDALSARTTTARTHLAAIAKLVERYKLAVLETAYFGQQTSEWERISFLDTTESTQNGLSKRRGDEGRSTKVLRLADLSGNVFVGDDPREIVLTEKEEERFSLLPDDIVIVRVNGSEKIVGRMLVWTNEPEWSYCDHFIRARASSTYSPSFIRWLFETNTIRAQIEATFVSSAGQKTINKTILSQVMVPNIPIKEQLEIVRWIETAFANIDRLASEATKAFKLADRLDQRILAKAFAGELVPQDPNDEPASALLERIREARANVPKKSRKKPTKAKAMKVTPQERVLTDSADWPEKGLPFEDIVKRLTLPYDDLKDAVFALLEGDAPKLRQQFDTDAKIMKIVRVAS